MLTLDEMLAAAEAALVAPAPPCPFNGATRLVLAPDVFRALAPHIETYATNPLIRPRVEIDVRPTLPAAHGMGFRPWRDGDDHEAQLIGETLVLVIAPKST